MPAALLQRLQNGFHVPPAVHAVKGQGDDLLPRLGSALQDLGLGLGVRILRSGLLQLLVRVVFFSNLGEIFVGGDLFGVEHIRNHIEIEQSQDQQRQPDVQQMFLQMHITASSTDTRPFPARLDGTCPPHR